MVEFKTSRLLTVALAVTLFAPLVVDPDLNPAASLIIGAVCAVGLSVTAVLSGRRMKRHATGVALLAGTALAAWLTAAALLSADPAVSFVGTIAQHTGAALWLVIAAWTAAAALLAERRTLRDMLAVVSVAGAVFSAMAVFEALTSGDRSWGSAAGPFENSSSLGAFLAVSIFASIALGLAGRRSSDRVISVLCTLLTLAGMAAAESRAGVVGALAGLIVVALVWLPTRFRAHRALMALGLPLAGIAGTGLLVAAATNSLGARAAQLVASLGTSRDAIWRSAAAQLKQAPLFGSGPEQFSAWVSWSFREGLLKYNGTYDPHNAILGLALGGGIVALAMWAIFAGTTTWAQLGVLERTGRPRFLMWLMAIPTALMASALFAWITPAAALAAAALTGAVFASDIPPAAAASMQRRFVMPTLLAVLGAACAAVAVISAPMFIAEWQYARLPQPADSAALSKLYQRWPDPSYASLSIESALASGADAPLVARQLAVPEEHATYHVDLALRELFLAQSALAVDSAEWDRFAAAIDTGVAADPASALWYTIGAAQADAMERTEERGAYARKALALDPPASERAFLENLVAE